MRDRGRDARAERDHKTYRTILLTSSDRADEWGVFGISEPGNEFWLLTVDQEPETGDLEVWLNCWWNVNIGPGNHATMTFPEIEIRHRTVSAWEHQEIYPPSPDPVQSDD